MPLPNLFDCKCEPSKEELDELANAVAVIVKARGERSRAAFQKKLRGRIAEARAKSRKQLRIGPSAWNSADR